MDTPTLPPPEHFFQNHVQGRARRVQLLFKKEMKCNCSEWCSGRRGLPLAWGVTLSIDLGSHWHLSKIAVPNTGHLVLSPSLWSLWWRQGRDMPSVSLTQTPFTLVLTPPQRQKSHHCSSLVCLRNKYFTNDPLILTGDHLQTCE